MIAKIVSAQVTDPAKGTVLFTFEAVECPDLLSLHWTKSDKTGMPVSIVRMDEQKFRVQTFLMLDNAPYTIRAESGEEFDGLTITAQEIRHHLEG
ncbi:hypothetical protein A2801_00090 [Candidatus Woesebacteria bacterium RIFCSPHIGHO2_01_FULL_41_10]|uniref:Uncharacterized protein n=1 Tax=Candidatus Woesebacteria bacterium RIFCSPHIGHO2_01_FULL_41_10 TaxID=1802500 RepID=A0A1F7YS92_9BACT|nr:MAG: hypothetical protein A2801_00090 [Candidatus Woesebacteria bacterium RIFCSPHIGHO2_01_FULL_41_10]